MTVPAWGSLAKSADDSETIEEAIARIVEEHNDDNESHLGEDQSLQSHKASEIIDHFANSIVADKLADDSLGFDKFNPESFGGIINYDSVDRFSQSLTYFSPRLGLLTAGVGPSYPDSGSLELQGYFPENVINNDRIWSIIFPVEFDNTGNLICFFGSGGVPSGGSSFEEPFFGFKEANNNLYAVSSIYDEGDDSFVSAITDLEITNDYNSHLYKVTYDPSDEIVRWFVDNDEVHTLDVSGYLINTTRIFSAYYELIAAAYGYSYIGSISYNSKQP